MLGLVPFVTLMIGLGVLAIAIALAAWPGRTASQSAARPTAERETTLTLEAPTHR